MGSRVKVGMKTAQKAMDGIRDLLHQLSKTSHHSLALDRRVKVGMKKVQKAMDDIRHVFFHYLILHNHSSNNKKPKL